MPPGYWRAFPPLRARGNSPLNLAAYGDQRPLYQEVPIPALGRLVEHDERSRRFVAPRADEPRSVLWGHHAPVLDQGNLGSCTGNALAQLINTDVFAPARPNGYLTEEDAVKIYSRGTVLDEYDGTYPPEDTGSSGLAVAKAAVEFGYFSTYNHSFGFDHFTATLQTQPVIVGTYWFSQMFKPDVDGIVRVQGMIEGGHEYLALGVEYETETLTFLNSWGSDWGLGGRFKMSFTDFSFLLNQEGDVTAPVVPVLAPEPVPAPPTPAPEHQTCCEQLQALIDKLLRRR